jgi:tetratricopeptide (TPR) repeat protein
MQILELTESLQPGRLRALALGITSLRVAIVKREYPLALKLLEASLNMIRRFGDKHELIYILQGLGAVHWFAGNWAQMRIYAEEYLKTAQELDDKNSIHGALWQLGAAACGIGDIDLGRSFYEQSLEIGRKENSPFTIASALRELAQMAHKNGEYARAKELYLECAQASREMRSISHAAGMLLRLGQIALHQRDPVQARARFEESLVIWREVKETEAEADILAGLAGVAGVAGQDELAAKLFGATEAAYKVVNSNLWWKLARAMDDLDHMTYDPIIATAREKLGEDIFNAEWEAGRQMSLEEAVAYALKELQ